MSERKQSDKRQETPEERAKRLRRQKLRREQLRRRRRKALALRGLLAVTVLAVVIGVIALIGGALEKNSGKSKKKKEVQTAETEMEMEAVDVRQITHLSFPTLIAVPETAFEQENVRAAEALDQAYLTVEEFKGILQQLYDKGYMLVSLKKLAQRDGDQGGFQPGEILIPKGKKPLVISQENVNYELSLSGQGFASRLLLDEAGKLVNERVRLDGSITTGDFDVITCVNTFVEEHPDFSYEGARGILGLTGYNGILGYRTAVVLGGTEGNRYASQYGIFDTAEEIEKVKPVLQALKDQGWEFACNGYDRISYTSGLEAVKADLELWKKEVGSLVGDVDILMYPMGNDIGGWDSYQPENETYRYLKEQGFDFFCSQDMSDRGTRLTEEYFRCDYVNLDGYRMGQDLYQGVGRFAEMLDFTNLIDQSRPMVKKMKTTE